MNWVMVVCNFSKEEKLLLQQTAKIMKEAALIASELSNGKKQ